MTYSVSESSKRSFHSYVAIADESTNLEGDKQSSSQSLMNSIQSLFKQSRRPRFNFKEERERTQVIGNVSPIRDARVLFQILDSDATNVVFSSWFLDRYQKIRPRRLTRLRVKEQKILTRHAKRLRQLRILSSQEKPVESAIPKRKKVSRAAQARKRKYAARKRIL